MKNTSVFLLLVVAFAAGSQNGFTISEGNWMRIERIPYSESTIKISEVTDTCFHFELAASSGSHFGEVAGTANLTGDKWIFEDSGSGDRIVLTMSADTLRVEFNGNIADYAGEGVSFDGNYIKGLAKQQFTFNGLGILSESEDRGFKRLVGSDYELFVNSFNMISEEEDLDKLDAKVFAGRARGLPTIVEAIIMVSPKRKIWAAVIDGDSVKYYSNVEAYLQRLPRTIDSWREGFLNKEVIFSSR
jgi:hypothetical protein